MRVISWRNLPCRLPICWTVVFKLALDFYKATPFIKGCSYTCIAIVWIAAIYRVIVQKQIKVFKD